MTSDEGHMPTAHLVLNMIRVMKLSGEELAAFPGMKTVQRLKRELHSLHGLPLCLQQLVTDGHALDDATELNAPSDVQLVLLTASSASQKRIANQLVDASCKGKVETLRFLFQARADMNSFNRSGDTALTGAAQFGQLEVLRFLVLEANAEMDLEDRVPRHADGANTAFLCACENGHAEVVHFLLEAGASTVCTGCTGESALMRASRSGHIEVVRHLVEARADLNLRLGSVQSLHSGSTALVFAAANGHIQTVQCLLEARANVDLVNSRGETALMCASQKLWQLSSC